MDLNKSLNPIISIIVPVYNVEDYLVDCIESLINQSYSNIEIILVNDGSTDRSPEICEKYAGKDSRVKVIHKLNGGLSDARNVGLCNSKGEFVLFVDSDDFIELDACEKFIEIVKKYDLDILVGNGKRIENGKVSLMHHYMHISNNRIMTGAEFIKSIKKIPVESVLNLYNREFLTKNNLMFKEGILHEDEHFTPRAYLKAKKVLYTGIVFYNYRIRSGSITQKKDKTQNGIDLINICYELSKIYDEIKDKELRRILNNDLVSKYLYGFKIGKLYRKEFREIINTRFLIGRPKSIRNICKSILFILNKRLYYLISNLFHTE